MEEQNRNQEMENRPTISGIVLFDQQPDVHPLPQEKRVFTGVLASCQLMLEDGGGLFDFPLPPDKTTVTVGRKVMHTDEFISVNLGPFNGFDMGVSRTHARFERAGSRLFLRDLNSTNGTWINGQRLVANHVYEVTHGDHIEFGRLPAKLFVKE